MGVHGPAGVVVHVTPGTRSLSEFRIQLLTRNSHAVVAVQVVIQSNLGPCSVGVGTDLEHIFDGEHADPT